VRPLLSLHVPLAVLHDLINSASAADLQLYSIDVLLKCSRKHVILHGLECIISTLYRVYSKQN